MSNEIATYSMILSKLSLGKSGTECPTKTQILAINSLIVIDNASTYGANECVKIDDIRKKAETWNYYLTVSPTSMSFGAGGGSKQFTYSSYKRKVLDGVEQSGDISVSLKTTSASGTGFSISGTTVSASANQTASNRTGKITLTQNESGKTQSIEITQSGYTPTYTFNVTPTNLSVTAAETNETLTVQSYKTVLKSDGSETTESLDYEFSSNNSWVAAARTTTNTKYITVAENETTTQRTAKITLTQAESGAQAFVNVIQDGKAEEVVNKLTLNSLTYDNCFLFLSGTTPVKPNAQNYFMFMANVSLNWYASRGITVNGGTAYAGNLVNIYVYSSGSYKLVKSFQLQLGKQTVTY